MKSWTKRESGAIKPPDTKRKIHVLVFHADPGAQGNSKLCHSLPFLEMYRELLWPCICSVYRALGMAAKRQAIQACHHRLLADQRPIVHSEPVTALETTEFGNDGLGDSRQRVKSTLCGRSRPTALGMPRQGRQFGLSVLRYSGRFILRSSALKRGSPLSGTSAVSTLIINRLESLWVKARSSQRIASSDWPRRAYISAIELA
jgi:hypothetical protein